MGSEDEIYEVLGVKTSTREVLSHESWVRVFIFYDHLLSRLIESMVEATFVNITLERWFLKLYGCLKSSYFPSNACPFGNLEI